MNIRRVVSFIFLFFILLFWQFGDFSFIMSSPLDVFIFLKGFLVSKLFWSNFLKTLFRVIVSCVLAFIIGVFLAFTKTTKLKFLYDIFYPTQFIGGAVLTLLCIVFFGLTSFIPILVVTLVVLPNIVIATEVGIRQLRPEFLEVGKLYSKNKLRLIWYVVVPQLMPYFLNGVIRAHAIAWKMVITTELFVVAEGLGYLLNNYFRLMQFDKLFGITIVIVCIAMFFDFIIRRIKEVYFRDYNTKFV